MSDEEVETRERETRDVGPRENEHDLNIKRKRMGRAIPMVVRRRTDDGSNKHEGESSPERRRGERRQRRRFIFAVSPRSLTSNVVSRTRCRLHY